MFMLLRYDIVQVLNTTLHIVNKLQLSLNNIARKMYSVVHNSWYTFSHDWQTWSLEPSQEHLTWNVVHNYMNDWIRQILSAIYN
jgi:hypothetical protein